MINLFSGKGTAKGIYPSYKEFLRSHEVQFFPYFTNGKDDSVNINRLLQNTSFDAISILGGDGTVNLVLNSLKGFDIPLHIIPCGLGNDLARTTLGQISIKEHFNNIVQQSAMEVDTYTCNGQCFSVTFGVGFDGEVSQQIDNFRKMRLPKQLAYWISVLKVIPFFKEVDIEINGEKHECFLLSLANTPYFGGGFKIAPDADINDRQLDYVLISKISVLGRIRNLLRVRKGNHLSHPAVTYKKVSAIGIFCEKEIPAHIDGELIRSISYDIRYDRKVKLLIAP